MQDQANHLRQLVRDFGSADGIPSGPRPRLVLVCSGKGGAGVTTLAVNLAVALTRDQQPAVLIDANPSGSDVAELCGLEERYTLADVLSGGRTLREALQAGPSGVEVLPGVWGLERLSDFPASAGQRLLAQLDRLGSRARFVVVDAGNGQHRVLQQLWPAADLILAVTTHEKTSILNSYALIKKLVGAHPIGAAIRSLVNRAPTAEVALAVHDRIAEACWRFLGREAPGLGHVEFDPMAAAAGRVGEPFVSAAANCDAARQVVRLAQGLAAAIADAQGDRARGEPPREAALRMPA